MANKNPEQLARDRIDAMLSNAGWNVQDQKKLNWAAGPGIAIREKGWRGQKKETKGYNLLRRLEKYKSAVLAFACHTCVPFTNNQAERDLRPAKVKQKMAGCFRTLHGARIYAPIQGYISTARKHGLNVFNEFRAALNGAPYPRAPIGS